MKLDILANEEELVTTLVDEVREAGTFEIGFDGANLQEGNYVCHFQAGDFVASKIMVVRRH